MRVSRRAALAAAVIIAVSVLPSFPAGAASGQWDAPITLSDTSRVSQNPNLATDGSTITATWGQFDGLDFRTTVSTSIDGGSTWSTPLALSGAGEDAFGQQVVTNGTTITVIWYQQDGPSSRIEASSSSDGGATWSTPVVVSNPTEASYRPRLVTDGSTLTATWYSFNGVYSRINVASSTDGGATWSTPVAISAVDVDTGDAELATDGATVTVTWYAEDGPIYRAQASSSTDGGATWSAPATLSEAGKEAFPFDVVTNGTTITIIWVEDEGSYWRVRTSSSTDDGASWGAPTVLSAASVSAYQPRLVTDGSRLIAIWSRAEGVNSSIQSAYSTDGGATWSAPVTVAATDEEYSEPRLVTDGSTVTAIWGGWTTNTQERVQTAYSTDGGVTWSSPISLSTVGHGARRQQIVTDGFTVTTVWQRETTPSRIESSSFTPRPDVSRLSGENRYETAVEISAEFDPGVPVVYLATGTNYPDALSAASAAALQGGPLLLTAPTTLPTVIRNELIRLNPTRVVIVGGTGVVSTAVENAVRAALPVADIERHSGSNRYETSRVIADRAFPDGTTTIAYLATGANFPDALSASAAAGAAGAPVILINGGGSSVDPATQSLFTTLGVNRVFIAGGTGVVSVGIENSLKTLLGASNVSRLSGNDRYATSVAINADAFDNASRVFLATGVDYPDALAGAALAGVESAPLFVTPRTCVPGPVLSQLFRLKTTQVTLLGGTGVLTLSVGNLTRC